MFPNSEPMWKRGDVGDDLRASEMEWAMLYSGDTGITEDLENPSTPSYCKWYNAIKFQYYGLYLSSLSHLLTIRFMSWRYHHEMVGEGEAQIYYHAQEQKVNFLIVLV